MNEDKWSSAILRINSKSRSIAEISRLLKTEPSRSIQNGSRLSWSNPDSAVSQENCWLLDSGLADSDPLEAHITKLITYIEQNASALKTLSTDCEIDLWCAFASGTTQGGVVLDAGLLKRFTAIPINLIIDLYPPEEKSATRQ
jgi:hypothetical protein